MARPSRAALNRAQRRAQVMEQTLAGRGLTEIAKDLGITRTTARKDYEAIIQEVGKPVAEEVLRLELQRLDKLTAAHWHQAIEGDTDATDKILACMDRRAKFLGFDKPAPANMNIEVTQSLVAFQQAANAITKAAKNQT